MGVDVVLGDVFAVDLPSRSFVLVYADPPYAGCRTQYARRNNSRQWGRNARADFMRDLIARMEGLRAPDGVCAVSMATPELELLPLFPSKRRVFAWTKPSAAPRPGVWPTYSWEPVVAWGRFPGRDEQRAAGRTPLDSLHLSSRVPRTAGHETPKPLAFADWILDLTLGPRTGAVCELFAGTGPLARQSVVRGCTAITVDLHDYISTGVVA